MPCCIQNRCEYVLFSFFHLMTEGKYIHKRYVIYIICENLTRDISPWLCIQYGI